MEEPLDEQLDRALAEGVVDACLTAEQVAGLPRGLLLALAAHESGLRNVEDRGGIFGIDASRHADWLGQQGSPTAAESASFVAGLISGAETFGHTNGVSDGDLLGFALAAYRTGVATALAGYAPRGSRLDTETTQYAAAVLARLPSVQRWLDARLGASQRRRLEPGASG